MIQKYLFAAKVLLVSALLSTCLVAAGPLAIQGAKIIPIVGEPIEVGTILIRDGKIVALGKDVDVPGEAKVIDATGKVVMPGFVDAHSASGMSQANEQNSNVPFLSVVDSIDPVADYFEECRRNGITSAAVVPGNSTLIGGKAAIVKTAGQYVNDMLVRRDSALKLSMRPTSGSRMSQMAVLRKEFDKAKKALEKKDDNESKPASEASPDAAAKASSEGTPEAKDGDASGEGESQEATKPDEASANEGLEALKLVVQGKMPVYVYCETPMDVTSALQLVASYGLKPIFVLGRDCYKAAGLLAKRGETVILDPTLVFWETNERTRQDSKIVLPELYRTAGVPFIFQIEDSGSRTTLGGSYFWYQAALAVKHGMSTQDALAALTLEPAKLLGIDAMVGSIEVGKDADLVLLTGEPLDIATWVEQTIVGGEVVYDRASDEKLKRLLSPSVE